VWHRFEAALL